MRLAGTCAHPPSAKRPPHFFHKKSGTVFLCSCFPALTNHLYRETPLSCYLRGDVGNGGHCQFFLNPFGRHAAAVSLPAHDDLERGPHAHRPASETEFRRTYPFPKRCANFGNESERLKDSCGPRDKKLFQLHFFELRLNSIQTDVLTTLDF